MSMLVGAHAIGGNIITRAQWGGSNHVLMSAPNPQPIMSGNWLDPPQLDYIQ